jgi:uncharacterized membrane protein YfcA
MLEIAGYLAAFLMGLTLGTIGAGGSILSVPILVYLMGIAPVTATGYSLLIVGATAAFGAAGYYQRGLVDLKAALIFAIPSIIAVYATRAYLMPALPDPLISAPLLISKDLAIMVLFAALMIGAALMMLKDSTAPAPAREIPHPYGFIILEGALIGVATGMLGAGGGFLIIPALVLLMGMKMKEAIGASLIIIALKSLIGFLGDIQSGITLQVPMLPIFLVATFAGMWCAGLISHRFDGKKLQQGFALFTLLIAGLILFKEFS